MDNLEKKILGNRDGIDSFEPSEGHFERFRNKLEPVKVSLYSRIPAGLKIAALIAFVAISSIVLYEQARTYYAGRQEALEEIMPGEFREARMYYMSQIREEYTKIDRLSESDPERKELLIKEMDDIDRLFKSVMKDLQTSPNDERVLSTMISHYQMKLDVLSKIIEQLEEADKINSTYDSHEKTEV